MNGTREKILNTATELFASRGFGETSVREIAQTAGVNLSMISYYFGGKEGLLESIGNTIAEAFVSYVANFSPDNQSDLLPHFEDFLTFLDENRLRVKIVLTELGKDHRFLLPIKGAVKDIQGIIAKILKKSGNRDSRLDKDLHLLTDIVLGMIFSDFVFDFSGFQDDPYITEKDTWRWERRKMLIRMLRRISGIDSGDLTFDSIL